MGTVDSLDILISAQATKANSEIDRLISKLGTLNTSLAGINGSGLTGLANGVNRLSNSMQNMKSVGTADFTRLAKNVQKITQIDTAGLNKTASALFQISRGFAQLNKVPASGSAKQLGDLAKGISQLGYKSATKAIENIPKLATAMKDLMGTLSKAPKVSQNLINMTNALANLARTGASSGRAANSLASALNTYSSSTSNAAKKSFSLASAIGKVYATYWLLFRTFGKIKEAIDLSSDLTEVQNVVDVTFQDMAYKVEDFAKTSIKQFGMSELSVKQYASRFQAMGSAMGITGESVESANKFLNEQTNGYIELGNSMSDVSLNLTKLTADMASFYNVEQKDVAQDLESIFTGQTRPLRTYGLDLTEATLSEWAMKRGMDANISAMSQAQKTMLRYQYVLSNTTAAQGDFARTSDTWANQIRILQEQFKRFAVVIGTGFINAFKPFVRTLNAVMERVIAFSQNVLNALGQIFGWKFEISGGGIADDFGDAAESASDLSDGIGKAADNAKKLKTITLGIDELNINAPDDATGTASGGGSSGAGAAGGDIDRLTTTMTRTDSMIEAYKSNIKSLYGLGQYIGATLTNTLASIPWDNVYDGARNFGTGLANFLNGLITPALFSNVGQTIAGSLNTAIYSALSFGQTFDFYEFGQSIASGINTFFETFDFASLAETLNVWADGILEGIKGALENLNFDAAYQKIKDFFENLEFDTVAVIIGALTIKKILAFHGIKLVKSFLEGKIASAIAGGLSVKVPSINIKGVKLLGGSLLKTIGGVAAVIGGAVASVAAFFDMWKNGWSVLSEIVKDIGLAVLAVGAIILGVPASIAAGVALAVGAITTIVILVKDHFEDIKKWISDFIRVSKETIKEFVDGVVGFFKGLWNSIQKIFGTVASWFGEKFEAAYNAVTDAFEYISSWFEDRWEDIKNVFASVKEFFKEKFESAYNAVTNAFKYIGEWFHNKWVAIKNVFASVKEFFKEKFESAYNAVTNAFSYVSKWFGDRWEDIKGVFSNVSGFFKEAFEAAYNAVTGVWDGIKEYFKSIANKILEPIGKAVNGVISGINWILDKVGATQLEAWTVPVFEKGSSGLPQDTVGVVNDQSGSTYKEMIVPPHGKPFIPEGRNVMLPMEKGTKIMPANQTKQFLNGIPHFAGGIGDFFGGLWEKAKDFTGNIWDYLTNPGKIVQIALDKFVDISGYSGMLFDMAKGTVSKVFDGVVNYIKGIFDDQTKTTYTPGAGVEQWRKLASVALQMTGQYSEANVNRLLMQMKHESGGNPRAINDWDINAKRGTPSKGLMQVIDPTFRSYAYPGYDYDIYDPLSNMLASIRYTVSRYGSLYSGWEARGYKGYAGGAGRITLSDLIPGYSVGGFPEDGLFMANHNELVGQFSDGRTAVANNEQITAGIEEAAYRGFTRAMSEDTRQESLMRELIAAVREGKRITVDGRELVAACDSRRSRNGFSFT